MDTALAEVEQRRMSSQWRAEGQDSCLFCGGAFARLINGHYSIDSKNYYALCPSDLDLKHAIYSRAQTGLTSMTGFSSQRVLHGVSDLRLRKC